MLEEVGLAETPNLEPFLPLVHSIQYKAKDWRPLPDWAVSLCDVGRSASRQAAGGNRRLTVVTVPNRQFAAALCAVGIVLAMTLDEIQQAQPRHLETLRTLPNGALVTYRPGDGARQGIGVFRGFTQDCGREYICIEEYNKDTHRFPIGMAQCVAPILPIHGHVPKPRAPRAVLDNVSVLTKLFGPGGLSYILSRHEFECLIVGNRTAILKEIFSQSIRLPLAHGKYATGTINDILHVPLKAKNAILRLCGVVSTQSGLKAATSVPVVIFDGAKSFLRWHSMWSDSHQLVILDRAERDFEAAIDTVNDLYIFRIEDCDPDLSVNLAPGIEIVSFTLNGGAQ